MKLQAVGLAAGGGGGEGYVALCQSFESIILHRSQHGVTLTETGEKLVAIMRQIDDMGDHLREVGIRTRR